LFLTDAIDCDDLCHLAWIIRDNRHLLLAVDNDAPCSNGTWLSELSILPDDYYDCPAVIKKGLINETEMNLRTLNMLVYMRHKFALN
jgi:hypothetical protein